MLLWTFILIFLTLVAVYFYVSNVFGAVSESVRASASLNSDKITGIINVLQASPSVTCNRYALPRIDCTLRIDNMRVNFTDNKNHISYINYYLQSPVTVSTGSGIIEIMCDPSTEKAIYMARCGNEIIISDSAITCGAVAC